MDAPGGTNLVVDGDARAEGTGAVEIRPLMASSRSKQWAVPALSIAGLLGVAWLLMAPPSRPLFLGYANTFHDPAVAVSDGDGVFAEGIERPAQLKRAVCLGGIHYAIRSLRRACKALGVNDPDTVVMRTSWAPRFFSRLLAFFFRLVYPRLEPRLVRHPLDLRRGDSLVAWTGFAQPGFIALLPITTYQLRRELFGSSHRPKIVHRPTSHHFAHAATAVYTSPFDECAVMILDGAGEKDSSAFFHYGRGRFRSLGTTPSEHSLGFLYMAMTQACGFSPIEGEEWKVMGVAAYGAPRREIYDFFRERIVLRGLDVRLRFGPTELARLEALVGGFRRPEDPDIERMADLAHNFQACFTDVVCELAAALFKLGVSERLAFGGGCALNSSANGRILARSGFKALHVPMAPGDDGNCLGLVLHEKYKHRPRTDLAVMSPYLGSDVDEARLQQILGFGGIRHEAFADDEALAAHVAELLDDGEIIGWMQGRAEFGPRALGNRSILADARRGDLKDRINARVKFREEYRPLAPSILEEHVGDYFAEAQPSPYMDRTLPFRDEMKARVPAAVHKDGTGRLQTVSRTMNPLYWLLIDSFARRTGVPVLVNTSLNVMGKPIVHGVEDAITLFFTTGLDHMVIGRHVLHKR